VDVLAQRGESRGEALRVRHEVAAGVSRSSDDAVVEMDASVPRGEKPA
jgi:hypothetical protein